MAVVEFHSDLEEQQNEAQLAEQLEGLLGFAREKRGPIRWPDGAQGRRAEQNAGEDFADGQRLAKSFAQTTKHPRGGNDEHPLQ